MRRLQQVLAVLGVVYLVVVATLYFVLQGRLTDFEKTAPRTTGTVVATVDRRDSEARDIFHSQSVVQPVIQYTLNGKTQTYVGDNTRTHVYQVGDKVTLLYAPTTDGTDPQVMIQGQGLKALRFMGWLFIAAAVAVAWLFGVLGWFLVRRRRRRNREREQAVRAVPAS